jgi:uncharacterized small protein (DUF1192 family)
LRKFKSAQATHPQVEKRKRLLLPEENQRLFRIADSRAKAILALGLMGQDESTICSLKVEQFEEKLGADKLEFVDLQRPKTGLPIKLVLTPEVQLILADYVTSLHRYTGWLFSGYQNRPLAPYQCNEIFKALCLKAGMKENGKRLSFHGLRMTFATRLRNEISDDIIDLLMGHAVRYDSAYLADDEEKLRELLSKAGIEDLLRLQEAPQLELSKELETQKAQLAEQQATIERLNGMYERLQAEWLEMKFKYEPLNENLPVRDVKLYERKTMQEQITALRAEIEALKKEKRER